MRKLQVLSVMACLALSGCAASDLDKAWSLVPFGKDQNRVSSNSENRSYQSLHSLSAAELPLGVQPATGWLASVHARVSQAMAGSSYQVEWRGNAVAVIAPVEGSFNPDRPGMLLPSSLRPLTAVAKLAAAEPGMAVLVLGQGDRPEIMSGMQGLANQRASNIASIFRLSGMGRDRLQARALAFTPQELMQVDRRGLVLGRRVEMLLVPRDQLGTHMLSYNH